MDVPLPASGAGRGIAADDRGFIYMGSSHEFIRIIGGIWEVGESIAASTDAVAAMGAIYWILTCAVLLFGGVGLAVQTFVAQAFGGGRFAYASRALWNALWATLAIAPVFLAMAFAGPWVLGPFGLDGRVEALALEYWAPRMGGAFVGSMAWAAMGFFNGIGAVRYTMLIVVSTTIANAVLNQLFMFNLGMGMSGAAWGTNVAQLVGLGVAMVLFLGGDLGRRYRSALTWRPRRRSLPRSGPAGSRRRSASTDS